MQADIETIGTLASLKEQILEISALMSEMDEEKFQRLKELLQITAGEKPLYLEPEEAARMIGCKPTTLHKARNNAKDYTVPAPPHIKLFGGEKVLYPREDLIEWARKHPRKNMDIPTDEIIKDIQRRERRARG